MTAITKNQMRAIAAGSNEGLDYLNGDLQLDVLQDVTSTAAELNILDGVTSTAAELNILDGVTSTAAELNLLDTAAITNAGTSVAAVLNAGGDIVTASNVGTQGTNVTAVEYGDGYHHITVLTLASVVGTIGDNAALSGGAIIYTLPASSVCLIHGCYMTVGITLTTGTPTTDAPDVGIGTLIGSGANATLNLVGAGAENILTGQTATNIAGAATVKTLGTQLVVETGDSHAIHFNYADTWADVDDTAATISGTVVLDWSFLA